MALGRLSGLFALVVLTAAALLGNALACHRRTPHRPLSIVHESDAISLDPAAVAESATNSILSNFYERLVTFDRNMRLTPALALSWTTPDDRTWVFTLRPGVRFHDGKTFTAADAKYSLDRVKTSPASGMKAYLATVAEVTVENDHTLRLRTTRIDPLLLNRLTYIAIVPSTSGIDLTTRPDGTGPYRFVSRPKGGALEAEAFPGYWGGKPAIERVRFLTVEEGQGSVRALEERRADVLRWVPEALAEKARSLPRVRVVLRSGLAAYYLWLDSRPRAKNPFADRRVRQAISLAIDRPEINKQLGGLVPPSTQFVRPGVFGYVVGLPTLKFDPAEASRLLREAGYENGFEATLTHRSQASVAAVAKAVQAMLGEVNIRLKLEVADWPRIVERWTKGQLPFFLAAWRFDDGDASNFLKDCLSTRDPAGESGSFNPGYSNPELDRLVDENGQILEEGRRLERYKRVMQLVMDEMPIVPLLDRNNVYGVSEDVRWEPRLDAKLLAAEVTWTAPD